MDIERINSNLWNQPDIVSFYDRLNIVSEPEKVVLKKIDGRIRNKKILDIGIGGGRSTKFMLDISQDYTGIDYSEGFVRHTSEKYKNVRILHCDARDMKMFQNEEFDFVMFSFNGIDYADHDGRKKILSEVFRVLKKGGLFLFSTHNMDYRYFRKYPWNEEGPWTMLKIKSSMVVLSNIFRHLKMKKHEVIKKDYAIINDHAHGFSLMTYYIRIPYQIFQLQEAGFHNAEMYTMSGEKIISDQQSDWIFYLTEK